MPNGVRSIRINVSNSNNNNQPPRPQVRRRATPPAQPRPVSRNRNLQVPIVPNILSNLSPFRRTKSTRSTRKIKGYKDTPTQGRKRKTKVNVAKRSKRASQKKRGRKMSKRGGHLPQGKYKDGEWNKKKPEGYHENYFCKTKYHTESEKTPEWNFFDFKNILSEKEKIDKIAQDYIDNKGDFKGLNEEKKIIKFREKLRQSLKNGSRSDLTDDIERFTQIENRENIQQYLTRKFRQFKEKEGNYSFFDSIFGTLAEPKQKIRCFLKYK